MGGSVSPDKYCPIWIATNRTAASWSSAHSCGDAHHNCTFVRFCAQVREDVQGMGVSIRILGRRKPHAMQQSPCTHTTAPT